MLVTTYAGGDEGSPVPASVVTAGRDSPISSKSPATAASFYGAARRAPPSDATVPPLVKSPASPARQPARTSPAPSPKKIAIPGTAPRAGGISGQGRGVGTPVARGGRWGAGGHGAQAGATEREQAEQLEMEEFEALERQVMKELGVGHVNNHEGVLRTSIEHGPTALGGRQSNPRSPSKTSLGAAMRMSLESMRHSAGRLSAESLRRSAAKMSNESLRRSLEAVRIEAEQRPAATSRDGSLRESYGDRWAKYLTDASRAEDDVAPESADTGPPRENFAPGLSGDPGYLGSPHKSGQRPRWGLPGWSPEVDVKDSSRARRTWEFANDRDLGTGYANKVGASHDSAGWHSAGEGDDDAWARDVLTPGARTVYEDEANGSAAEHKGGDEHIPPTHPSEARGRSTGTAMGGKVATRDQLDGSYVERFQRSRDVSRDGRPAARSPSRGKGRERSHSAARSDAGSEAGSAAVGKARESALRNLKQLTARRKEAVTPRGRSSRDVQEEPSEDCSNPWGRYAGVVGVGEDGQQVWDDNSGWEGTLVAGDGEEDNVSMQAVTEDGSSLVVTNRFVRGMFEAARDRGRGRGTNPRGRGVRGGSARGRGSRGNSARHPPSEDTVRVEDTDEFKEAMAKVHAELDRLRDDRARLQALRQEVERERARMERGRENQEKGLLEREREMMCKIEEEKRKLQRDRRVLDKQTKALLKLPNKRERAEIEEKESEIKTLKDEMQSRDARHRLTCDRLRKQIADQADKISELKDEVRWHEKRALELGGQGTAKHTKDPSGTPSTGPARGSRMASPGLAPRGVNMSAGPSPKAGGPQAVYEDALRQAEARSRAMKGSKPSTLPRSLTEVEDPFADDVMQSPSEFGHDDDVDFEFGGVRGRSKTPSVGISAHQSPIHSPQKHLDMGSEGSPVRIVRENVHLGHSPARRGLYGEERASNALRWSDNGEGDVGRATVSPSVPAANKVDPPLAKSNGKRTELLPGGGKRVAFANGTTKEQWPDGRQIVWFANGDVRKTVPGKGEEYFYSEVDTWHTTAESGVEVFHFANGQTEAHHPNGAKEVLFSDGAARMVMADGSEKDIPRHMLCKEIVWPRPAARLS